MEDRINEIYEVFKEYFGEEKVDLQDDRTDLDKKAILVWFPEVTVTNEHDQSTNITDLYIRVRLSNDGYMIGVFDATRGSYKMSQVYGDYLHSHARNIPHESYGFSAVCLGRGPIQGTCTILNANYDLDRWRLFCYELDKYVTVESEEGIPYRHLNQLSVSSWNTKWTELDYNIVSSYSCSIIPEVIKDFLPQFVENIPLNFVIEGDHWFIAHSFLEYISILTTAFKKYVLENNIPEGPLFNNVLLKGQYDNGKFKMRVPATYYSYVFNPVGLTACKFKGEEKIITVENDLVSIDDSKDVIINPDLANIILFKILSVLNYGTIRKQEGIQVEEDGVTIL